MLRLRTLFSMSFSPRRSDALRVSVAAMFVALTVLVAYLPTVPGSAFKFAGFPLLLGGLLVGPRTGLAIGVLTDGINFALHPSGPFFPGFMLTQGLTAMIPGLMFRFSDPLTGRSLDGTNERPSWQRLFVGTHPVIVYLRLLFAFGLTKLFTSVLLVSYFTSVFILGTPLAYELGHRALIQAFHVPVYAFLAQGVLQGLSTTDLYRRILKARR